MPGLPGFNKPFIIRLSVFLLAAIGIGFLVSLGFWQLHRAEEKKNILAEESRLSNLAPVRWNSGDKIPIKYQRITVSGKFLPVIFLLDNQHSTRHQFGYHIISPLKLTDGKILLVDRGWVSGDVTRRTYPIITTPQGEVTLTGMSWHPSLAWSLGPMFEKQGDNLTIVEHIDTKMISELLQKNVYPFIMRLQKSENHGFEREWVLVSMPPARHQAYAVQWFAMAFVLFVIVVGLSMRKKI